MIYRAIDADGDWQFGKGKASYLRGQDAIIVNIETRLKSFLNDTFWNMAFGIDWFSYLGNRNTQRNVVLACRAMILQSYGVKAITSMDYTLDETLRALTLNFVVNTIYSSGVESAVVIGA